MALYTLSNLKAYLRIQHSADDALLGALALSAVALIEAYLHRPIALVTRTDVDDAPVVGGGRVQHLLVPAWPVAALTSVVHDDGDTVPVNELAVLTQSGRIRRLNGAPFRAGPWTITYTAGLAARTDYTAAVAPVIEQAVRDVVADLYLRRNPAATQEGEGGGVTVQYGGVNTSTDAQGLPLRTAALLRPFRLVEASA